MDKYVTERIKSKVSWIIAFILATVWLLVTGLPFVYMVMNSFKNQFEMLRKGVFRP